MPETDVKPRKLVREFRQILVWPIQLMPLREDAQIQEHWEALSQPGAEHPWRELRDEFSCDPAQFQQRHYSEFVTFLPYVRRFLYGEGKGRTGAGAVDSPIRVFRRNDVAAMRATLAAARKRDDHDGRRARRPVLLLRHRRRDPDRRGLRQRPDARAGARHAASVRARLSDVLARRRHRRPLPRARRMARPRRRRARDVRLRAAVSATSNSSAATARRDSPRTGRIC